jgi:hypothetical protein
MAGVFRAPPRPAQRRKGLAAVPQTATLVLGGSSTPTGGLFGKVVIRSGFTGSSTPTGAAPKVVIKAPFTGSSTPTGTVVPRRVFLLGTLTGSSTPSGSLTPKVTTHVCAGTSTPAGALTKAVTRKFAGASTPTGSMTPLRLKLLPVSGSSTPTGAIVAKQVTRRFAGSSTPNGGGPKSALRKFAGSSTPTGAMTPVRVSAVGSWTSAPILLPTTPLAGTVITWQATVPPEATMTVQTSVDNGASWQTVTNNSAIPNLSLGVRVVGSVMVRVLMDRPPYYGVGPLPDSPSMTALNVRISSDAGVAEYCPLGVFLLDDVAVTDTAAGAYVEIAGADLSRRVARNAWDATYTVQPGTNYGTAISAMLLDRMPDVQLNFASTDQVTPQLQFGQSTSNDPWQDIQQMALSIGYECYFDARGICVLRHVPDPDINDSQWEFEDSAHPLITALVRRVSDSNTYNKVIATGEGTGNDVPVQATAIDDDPASPTFYLGPYGTVTYRFTSPLILTVEQAQQAADAMLRQVKGATEAVEIDVVPMPAIEPGDVVTVTRGRSKVEGRFLVDQLTTPLSPMDTQHFTARRQRA